MESHSEIKRIIEKIDEEEKRNSKNSWIKREEKTIVCQICEEPIEYIDLGTLNCGCIFHRECIRGHIEANIGSKKLSFNCPGECQKQMTEDDILEYIDGELRIKYDKFSFDLYVENGNDEISWCPTADCTAVFCHDGNLDNYRCPVCKRHYCLNCRCDFHINQTCAEYRINNTFSQNDKKFEDFVKGAKFKQCPKCKFWVERSAGCNSMVCRCGNQFCYECGGSGCPHGRCQNSGRNAGPNVMLGNHRNRR